ncbi:lysine-rich coiled-coil protein 1 isoform X1 [Octodon degus]|uniref:Lysine-rich coiled-coil protein 1 n=2 Tax=Octodon degus TaxID=10160 RepID=A0A6P6DFE8_OCTDE|nr:lysine-rich coiled-coil protein 1 isoform X1 [Octodon degus]XP_023558711.1 lysine-rich coiled-coil protein 1 isoform X1 [Octodon degus]
MRESLFVNLMKHSKSYDSFQDELEDYIKVQKARGLEPKTCFRRMREDYLESCGYREEVDPRPRYRMFDQRLPSGTVQTYPRPHNISQTENWLPQWFPVHDNRPRLESLSYCQYCRDCFSEKPVPLNLSQQAYNHGSASTDAGSSEHLFLGARTGAHPASHQKRRRHPEKGKEKPKEERPKHKRKRGLEVDLEEHESIQRKKTEIETDAAQGGTEKPKHRKERKS